MTIRAVSTISPNSAQMSHLQCLCNSYQHWMGEPLIAPAHAAEDLWLAAYDAPWVLLAHGTETDPVFNYANGCAQTLFEMSWPQFVQTPSRLSAEPLLQVERDALLDRVTRFGYINDYSGVRITRDGRRFRIENATVWNIMNDAQQHLGQAARFAEWTWL